MEYKTNVMRLLDSKKIKYQSYDYTKFDVINGLDVARCLNQDPNKVFKTLVTIGKSNKYYVFVIPVNKELDLKKAAKSVNEKNIEMIKSKDLLATTGYIHGGCSPIGMKKSFPTTFDIEVNNHETIIFSAGKIGYQVEVKLEDIKALISYRIDELAI